MTTTHPRRRFFSYSLRTLFVVVTVFCVLLGTVVKQTMRAKDQRRAVEAIRDLGGDIRYEHDMNQSDPPGPEWLRQLFGDEYFFSVRAVLFGGHFLYHQDLGRLPDPDITDEDLVHLKSLTNLWSLGLTRTRVTDAGVKHLKDLTELRWLELRGTQITDAGLVHLIGLTSLQKLDIRNTQVTAEGVKKLRQALPNCGIIYKPRWSPWETER